MKNYGGLENNSLTVKINTNEDEEELSQYDIHNSSYYTADEMHQFNNKFVIMSLNCQSLRAKFNNLLIYLDNLPIKPIALLMQETWIKEGEYTSHLNIPGYKMISQPCRITSHGGLTIYVNAQWSVRSLTLPDSDIFEIQGIELFKEHNSRRILVCNIYRPPRDNSDNYNQFIEEFNNICADLSNYNKEAIIGGDFNINLLQVQERAIVREHINTILGNGFMPTITYPTRFSRSNCTLIDQFVVKVTDATMCQVSGILVTSLSDHLPYFMCLNYNMRQKHDKYITIRQSGADCIHNFVANLEASDLAGKCNYDNPNDNYNSFHRELQLYLNKCFPEKTVKINHYKHKKSPWVTTTLLKSIKYKDTLYKTMKCLNPDSEAYAIKRQEFQVYSKILKKMIRNAKREHYDEYFSENSSNSNKIWSKIKEIIGKGNNPGQTHSSINVNGQVSQDERVIANAFNDFFCTVAHDENNQSNRENDGDENIPEETGVDSSFSFDLISTEDVVKITNNLSNKKSSGFDGISTNMLKKIIHVIKLPLTKIINQSLQMGIFPDLLSC